MKGVTGNPKFKRSGEVLAAQRRKSRASGLNSERMPVAKQYHNMHATKFLPFYLLAEENFEVNDPLFIFIAAI